MIEENKHKKVYLATSSTDFRRGINGLAVLVQEQFDLDPFSTSLYVFCNRRKDKIKCLYWDHNGFWLLQRQLEQGKFDWPEDENDTITIGYRELRWLLDGLSIKQNKAFKQLSYSTII